MKTTALFAELIVIGVGALGAVLLLVCALVPEIVPLVAGATAVAVIPALAVMYLFGIMADLAAAFVFDKWIDRDAKRAGETRDDRRERRDQQLSKSTIFAERNAYVYSRMRILRGWAFNAVLLVPTSIAFLYSNSCSICDAKAAWMSGIGCALVAVGCVTGWHRMYVEEGKAVKRVQYVSTPSKME
jgi:hypothetical protein